MKKMIISAIALSVSLMSMAVETAYLKITLQNAGGENRSKSELRLFEDSENNASYESSFDSEQNMMQSNGYSTVLYAIITGHKLGNIATDNLIGTKIGFVTNRVDTDYKLVFSDATGHSIALKDKLLDSVTVITNTVTEYAFSVEAAQIPRVTIEDRFEIVDLPGTVPTTYQICYQYGKFKIDNPDAVSGNAYILDSIGENVLVTEPVPASSFYEFTPSILEEGKKYKVVGLKNDTLVFRHKPTPVTPAP